MSSLKLWRLKAADVMELNFSTYYFILRVEKDTHFLQKINILIEPLIEFKNCLPIPVELDFNNDSFQTPKQVLSPQDTYQLIRFSIHHLIYFSIKLTGFEKSVPILAHNKNLNFKKNDKIPVLSLNTSNKDFNNFLNIHMIYKTYETGLKKIFVYARACIVNATNEDLIFFNSVDGKMKGRIPGQENDIMQILPQNFDPLSTKNPQPNFLQSKIKVHQ